jgi:putative ABC transport system permease protein|tara:strand:- start:918 stop:2150 length:1233 start_codon:yes stop_codon:yes gene_type:complete
MFNRDRWFEILETIKNNKLRTFLAGFTVALGILIFIVLFGFGNGLENTLKEYFKDDKFNTIFISGGRTSKPFGGYESNRRIELTNEDMQEISEKFDFFIEGITPRVTISSEVGYKLKSNNYTIRGVGPHHQYNEMTIMMFGRYLNELDIMNKEKNIVIGRLVKQDLFGDEKAIGKYLTGGGRSWKVVGVFQDDTGDNEERTIYAPYTTMQKILKNTDEVDQIILSYNESIGYDGALELEKKLKTFLKNKKKIDPSDPRGIRLRSASKDLKENQDFSDALAYIILLVGIGTLLAGVIGISNIMVFVVKERTKEFGIRKAVGASPKSIIAMVLQEAIFITTISGYFGLFVGVGILSSLGDTLEKDYYITDPYVDLNTAVTATIMLIIFGAIAGYIPARRASKIKPIEALNDK